VNVGLLKGNLILLPIMFTYCNLAAEPQ